MRVTDVAFNVIRLGWGEAARHLPTQYAALNIGKGESAWHVRKASHNSSPSSGPGSFFLSFTTDPPSAHYNLHLLYITQHFFRKFKFQTFSTHCKMFKKTKKNSPHFLQIKNQYIAKLIFEVPNCDHIVYISHARV